LISPANQLLPPDLSPLHLDLAFMAPLSEQRAAGLADFLAADLIGTVTDVGCGWAELLIRILEAAPNATGVGIDIQEDAIAHAKALACRRGVARRMTLRVGDARKLLPGLSDAAVCIGASQIWGPPVEARMPLDYRSALGALRALLRTGGSAIYGEGIWTANPTPEAVAPLAGRTDEYVFMPELLDIARDSGFAVIQVHQATLDEWDAFESGYAARYARWLASHPVDHPDAPMVRAKLDAQRNAYFRGYRGVLGMAYLCLLAA
jgi:cyclopropane fatty-acyl-phospholipid synthase-like methyltransferase